MVHITPLRKFILIFILILVSTSQARTVSAGNNIWTSIGPEGGYIRAMAIDPVTPTTLYAGTFGAGVFKSTNGGENWSAVNTGLKNYNLYYYIFFLEIDPATPTTLYAGENYGVFKSTNGGVNWNAVNNGLTSPGSVFTLAIDPQRPDTLYVGTLGGGVFKSTNGGGNWYAVNNGLTSTYVAALAIDPNTPSTIFAGTNGGVFKSTNSGENWFATNIDLTTTVVHSLAIDPATPTTLFAGTIGGGVFKSTNGGGNWVNSGLPTTDVISLAIDPETHSTLYAGTGQGKGVFVSTNGGGDWNSANPSSTPFVVFSLVIDAATPSILYAGTDANGIFKSTNSGVSWTTINSGITNTFISTLSVDSGMPTTIYAGTEIGDLFKSTNGGGNWSIISTGPIANDAITTLVIDSTTPSILYVGTPSGVFKSTNSGENWIAANTGLTNTYVYSLAIDPLTPTTLYAGTNGGVFKSMNSGENWVAVNLGLTTTWIRTLVIDPTTPSTLYAGAYPGVFKSTNGGGNWSATGLTGSDITALVIDPKTPATLYGAGNGVFKSTNGGGNWSAVNTGLTKTNIQVFTMIIDPVTTTTLYIGTYDGGVFKSTNGGGSWSALNNGLPVAWINALTIDPATPSKLYAGTYGLGAFVIQQPAPTTYSISGKVTVLGGGALAGVVVSTDGGKTAVTDDNGNYTLIGLATGNYPVTPSKAGYIFGPASRTINLPIDGYGFNFSGFPCIAPSGLDICKLQPGDILLEQNFTGPIDAMIMIGGSYFTHAALYLGIVADPGDQNSWRPAVAEAQGPSSMLASKDPKDEVWETSLLNTWLWTGDNVIDWAAVRPSSEQAAKDTAIIYARNKASEIGVTYWACEDDPICGYLHPHFPLIPLNLSSETHFYCSGLVWKAYQHAGVDVSKKVGLIDHISGWILPDDLYFGSPEVESKPGMNRWIARIFSPAHLTLKDGEGQITGYDPSTGTSLNQIPGTSYSGTDTQIEAVYINYTGNRADWSLIVTGYDQGSYKLETGLLESDSPYSVIPGLTSPGKTDTFPVIDRWYFTFVPALKR